MNVVRFRSLIARRLGIAFDDSKLPYLAEVLQRRADLTGHSVDGYVAWAEAELSFREISALAAELTVGETYFFRNADQFRAFSEVVLPGRLRIRRPVRILSAGCASGEEAYTIAMLSRDTEVSIRAVDLNPVALERAARARYSTWALRETPDDARRAWFVSDGRDLVLDRTISGAVRFEQRNLIDDAELWSPGSYDVVFCRNVIMYFSVETQAAVIAQIERALAPGGYLFLGHAETLRGLSDQFHLCHTHDTFYYRRRGSDEPQRVTQEPPPIGELAGTDSWVDAIARASERIRALTEPPAVTPVDRRPARHEVHREALELLRDERYGDAISVLEQVPVADGDREHLLLQAVLFVHGSQLAEAEDACRKLLLIDELDAGAHYVLALCREALGDRAGAIDHDQTAAYLDPGFAMPRLHLGLLARRAGDHQTACRELTKALELLRREEAARLLMFGGGFQREALIALCKAELAATEAR